jgi:hypothetical protein
MFKQDSTESKEEIQSSWRGKGGRHDLGINLTARSSMTRGERLGKGGVKG